MGNKLLLKRVLLFVITAFMAAVAIAMLGINAIDGDISVFKSELKELSPRSPITISIDGSGSEKVLEYKLCNILPVKKVNATVSDDREVYLGGKPLGIAMKANGLIVSEIMKVVTDNGVVSPLKNSPIERGDVLTHINGRKISSLEDVTGALRDVKDVAVLTLERNGKPYQYTASPAVDSLSGDMKLGLYLREEIQGIGTLTYIDAESGRYGALGHVIKDSESGKVYSKPNGNIYDANIAGVVKGQKGRAGELSGAFDKSAKIGTLDSNCDFGIFGQYSGDRNNLTKVTLGSKYSVKPGKAYIYTTVDGERPKKYEIEIIKNSVQNTAKTRGLLIRVTDKELLEKSGGIVQGMSGSPIIQNGKLIGAVTHVFIGDPTKGYGTYIDWMLPN